MDGAEHKDPIVVRGTINTREKELKMFGGLTLAELKASKPLFLSNQMYAMSILSDVQEYLERNGDREVVRQMLNRAKFFISESMGVER